MKQSQWTQRQNKGKTGPYQQFDSSSLLKIKYIQGDTEYNIHFSKTNWVDKLGVGDFVSKKLFWFFIRKSKLEALREWDIQSMITNQEWGWMIN